jgi:hypothetical protein
MQAVAFLAGFMAVTVPYSAALSDYFGRLTIIDTHGSIHLESGSDTLAPSLFQTAAGLARAIATRPGEYLTETIERARSLFHVNGGRILQIYVVADNRMAAAAWKTFVHLGSDLFLVAGVLLAALGAAISKRPRVALVFLLWTVINVGIASVGGFGGARLRAPFEPMLLVLAAALCAGEWRRPHRLAVALATATGLVMAVAVLPQVPQSLRAWPDYGIRWPSIFERRAGQLVGAAGLNVPAYNGVAVIEATQTGSQTTDLQVRVGGVPVRTVQLTAGEPGTIRTLWPPRGLAFVELNAPNPTANLEGIHIVVEGR